MTKKGDIRDIIEQVMKSQWSDSDEIMSKPFDFLVHKKTFTNYLEIVITPEGKAYYAVPSHRMFAIAYYFYKFKGGEFPNAYKERGSYMKFQEEGIEREYQLSKEWNTLDILDRVLKETKLILVNNKVLQGEVYPTEKQLRFLRRLVNHSLFPREELLDYLRKRSIEESLLNEE